MTNNFLHADSIRDIAEGLVDRAAKDLPQDLRAAFVRRVIAQFHESEHDAIPVRMLPQGAPDWAKSKPVAYLVAGPKLQGEVATIAAALARARILVASDRLKARESQLHADLRTFLNGLAHQQWDRLATEGRRLLELVNGWEAAQVQVFTRRLVAGDQGRVWRRLRCNQELWDISRNSQWCTRRRPSEYTFANYRMVADCLAYWILENGSLPVCLLSLDVDRNLIHQVRDIENSYPYAFRNDIMLLIAATKGTVDGDGQSWDVRQIALADHLGHPHQAFISGEIVDRRAEASLVYRLWVDEERQLYLAAFPDSATADREPRLRLDSSEVPSTPTWTWPALTGLAPAGWSQDPWKLMERVLASAYHPGRIPLQARKALNRVRRAPKMGMIEWTRLQP